MEELLHLSKLQFDLLWRRRAVFEAKFKVNLNVVKYGDYEKELCICSLVGEMSDIVAFKIYVKEVLVQPEIIEIISYPRDLRVIFRSPIWNEIFRDLFNASITQRCDGELQVSGTESCVKYAVSAFAEITATYSQSKDSHERSKSKDSNERSLASQLVIAVKACKRVNISANPFEVVPNDVIKLLLSLLQKAYGASFPESVDDSVMAIYPVSDSDVNLKSPLESCSSENLKKMCERKLKNKKSTVKNVNGTQGSGELSQLADEPDENLQCPKGNSIFRRFTNLFKKKPKRVTKKVSELPVYDSEHFDKKSCYEEDKAQNQGTNLTERPNEELQSPERLRNTAVLCESQSSSDGISMTISPAQSRANQVLLMKTAEEEERFCTKQDILFKELVAEGIERRRALQSMKIARTEYSKRSKNIEGILSQLTKS